MGLAKLFIKGEFPRAAFIPVLVLTNPACMVDLSVQTLLFTFFISSSLWCLFQAQPKAQPHTGGCLQRQGWGSISEVALQVQAAAKGRMLWLGAGDVTPPRVHLALLAARISLQSSRLRCKERKCLHQWENAPKPIISAAAYLPAQSGQTGLGSQSRTHHLLPKPMVVLPCSHIGPEQALTVYFFPHRCQRCPLSKGQGELESFPLQLK